MTIRMFRFVRTHEREGLAIPAWCYLVFIRMVGRDTLLF